MVSMHMSPMLLIPRDKIYVVISAMDPCIPTTLHTGHLVSSMLVNENIPLCQTPIRHCSTADSSVLYMQGQIVKPNVGNWYDVIHHPSLICSY